MPRKLHNSAVELALPLSRRKRKRGNTGSRSAAELQSFSIVGRRYSAGSSRRFSLFFSDRFERRWLVYVGADYSNLNIPDESSQYDLNGNRELVTNANGDLVVYSTGLNNELNSDGNYSYTYDAEGNRISKTNSTGTERELYEWDYRNRLSKVTKQTFDSITETWQTVQIVEYAYDYNNVLIRKVLDADSDGISDSKTIFLPENYQTAVQLDDADLSDSTYETVSHRYLWTPGLQDKLLADVTPTETLWTLTDHLGTIRDIIQNTPSGLLVPAHVIYDAYGNILSCKDPNGMDIESPVLFGFTGKYFDADTQLQNNVNRWYDATTGRWLSTDPIGFNGNDTNLYRYVGNGSLNYVDSLGNKAYMKCVSKKYSVDNSIAYWIIKTNCATYKGKESRVFYEKLVQINDSHQEIIKSIIINGHGDGGRITDVNNDNIIWESYKDVTCCITSKGGFTKEKPITQFIADNTNKDSFIILQACYSSSLAKQLSKKVPNVIIWGAPDSISVSRLTGNLLFHTMEKYENGVKIGEKPILFGYGYGN